MIKWVKRKCHWLNQKARQHNVNPVIFISIYLSSLIPYYFGVYLMLKGSGILNMGLKDFVHFVPGKNPNFNINLIFLGFLINRLGWAIPFLYIEFWGKGLRWYIHLGIWVWILLSFVSFIRKVFF